MKRTAMLLLALVFVFSSGLFATSAFQKSIEKKANDFSNQRPLLVLGFDISKEGIEEYEVKTFIPDTSFMAKIKKFFTKKDYGVEKIEIRTRKALITSRLKLFSLDKKKACQNQEITATEVATVTGVNSVKIFSDNEFWEAKKGEFKKGKISLDLIASSVLPDWFFMHSQFMKEAVETAEKLDGKTYRFINCKWIKYYIDTDTLQPNTIEVNSMEKKKAVSYKIKFSQDTFSAGKVNIPRKVSIYKDNSLFKEYRVTLLNTTDRINDSVFDPAIQSKELNRMAAPKVSKKAEEKK